MVLKELTQAELAILAAGPPAHRLHDERVWRAERNKYDRLVRRQRELAKAAQPPRRSSRLEQKKLFVSDEWLAKEHPTIGRVEAGTPIESPTHVKRRRISAISRTPGGSEHVEAEVVVYTIPPPEESASAQKRRFDRGRR